LTQTTVKNFRAAFNRLRRLKFASNWKGGFYSMEVTNEGRGWHLHLHAIVDAKWIDSGALARAWAKCVGQEFAIVKVKDVRGDSYLREVTKYLVKGSELAGWEPSDIATFIDAFNGVRCFGVFGSLYGKRTEFREWLDLLHEGRITCDCGCNKWRILSEDEYLWLQLDIHASEPRPPPKPSPQSDFAFCTAVG
jgi:hypothetical protein